MDQESLKQRLLNDFGIVATRRRQSTKWIIHDCEFPNGMGLFWEQWRIRSAEMRQIGLSPKKDDDTGEWSCLWWQSINNGLINDLREDVARHALVHQRQHIIDLVNIIHQQRTVLDCSDTGTGKTFAAILAAKQLNRMPIVMCPLSVKSSWKRAMQDCGVTEYYINNIEQFRVKKTPYFDGKWHVADNQILIMDEVHRMANRRTKNGKMLLAARRDNVTVLAASATAALDPLALNAIGDLLRLYKPMPQSRRQFLFATGCDTNKFGDLMFFPTPKNIKLFHSVLFPTHAARMRIADIPDFPETLILAEPIDAGKKATKIINESYLQIADAMKEFRQAQADGEDHPLTKVLRLRQAIECQKAPLFVEMTLDALLEGRSVAIFVNFTETLELIKMGLDREGIACGLIRGKQTENERDQIIEQFRQDSLHVVISIIQAGGVGISLHDTNGIRPRTAIIAPTWSAVQMKQALGRVHRSGGLTTSIQRLIYCSGTIEEQVASKVREKIRLLGRIHDLDRFAEEIVEIEQQEIEN